MHEPSDEEIDESLITQSDDEGKQKLWPLFVLGLAFVGFGFYMALDYGGAEPVGEMTGEIPNLDERLTIDAATVDEETSVQLSYGAFESRNYILSMSQTREGERTFITDVDLQYEESRDAESPDEGSSGMAVRRTYSGADVSLKEGGEPVGREITKQVQVLLKGASESFRLSETGDASDFEWESVTNPQVRKILEVMRDGTELLRPRLRRGGVNPGETWTSKVPTELNGLEEEGGGLKAHGDISVETTFTGVVEHEGVRLAVLEQIYDLRARGEGDVSTEGETIPFQVTGHGSGRLLFDIERGAVHEATMTFDRRTTIDGKVREAQLEFTLRTAGES